jgi:hypothetical protein
MNSKLVRNFFNALHAIIVVFSYLTKVSGVTLVYISLSYFIADTLYELSLKPSKIYDFGITLHHFFSMLSLIYLREDDPLGQMVYYLYFSLELSNLPMYVVYYLKQIKYCNTSVFRLLLMFETIFYIYMRLYLGGSRVYEYFQEPEGSLIIKTYMVIFVTLSAIWSIKLLSQI